MSPWMLKSEIKFSLTLKFLIFCFFYALKQVGQVSKTVKWQNILVKLAKQQNGKTFWSS